MRRVLLTLLALFLVTLGGALWYASNKGFTSKWRNYVSDEFRKRGLEVTLRRLNLDPVRGLVAREVRIYDAKDRRRTLAVIDEMALQVNLAKLMRDEAFLEALELRDANLTLSLDPEKPRGPKIEIAHLNARLFLPPQQVYLAHADAEIFGLRVTASGRLIHPEAIRSKIAPQFAISEETLGRIIDQIATVKFKSEAPELTVTFSGDLADPGQIFVDAALWGEHLRREQYELSSLYIAAGYRGGVMDLKQLIAVDPAGELRLSGLWEPADGHVQAQLRSNLDLPALVRSFGLFRWLDEYASSAPPSVDLHIEGKPHVRSSLRVLGHLGLGKFSWRSVVFEQASADFSWEETRWSVRNAELVRAGEGKVTGDLMRLPEDFRGRLESTVNPKALRPWLKGPMAEALSKFEFGPASLIHIDAIGTGPTLDLMTITGQTKLDGISFDGVPAQSGTGELRFEKGILSLRPFGADQPEGLRFDFRDEGQREADAAQ